jgi:hypothetical protein
MTDNTPKNYRMERIERLLRELEYEVIRGMMEREIDETLGFRFVVPVSNRIPKGVVECTFRTRPTLLAYSNIEPGGSKLRVVK